MRKITFGVANSLDNFIARKNHEVDWLIWTDDVTEIMTQFWKTIDTVLMGRKTFEVAQRESKKIDPYPGVKTYVFSSTLPERSGKGFQIVSRDAVSFVRELKSQPGKDMCLMGGGELAKSMFEANLVDEVGLNIHPVVLGSGIPLFFEMERQIDLELIETKPIKKGCIYVLYRVKH